MVLGSINSVDAAEREDDLADGVLIDLDTVLLGMRQGRRGTELNLTADLPASLDRLHEVARRIIVLVDPPPRDNLEAAGRETPARLQVLHEGLGPIADGLDVILCPHDDGADCDCAKPGSGLVEQAVAETGIRPRNSWYIGGDQEGIQGARNAGLRTVRIGPLGEDHLSAVHRPDYEARDLLDAANTIMLDALTPAN